MVATICKVDNYELFRSDDQLRAIRKDDLHVSKDLSSNAKVGEFLQYSNEFTESEINDMFNQLDYFEN